MFFCTNFFLNLSMSSAWVSLPVLYVYNLGYSDYDIFFKNE